MQNPPFVPLSRKRFTSKDFKKRLDENLEPLERDFKGFDEDVDAANDEIRNAETRIDESRNQVEDDDWLGKANASVDPKQGRGAFGKFHEWANTNLTGNRIQEFFKRGAEEMDDPNKEGIFKTTGKGDLQDWLGWGEATIRGAKRGTIEGIGAAADSLTKPYDLAAMGTGFGALGAATRGARGLANTLRIGTKLASAPIAYEGGKGMYESGGDIINKGFEGFDFDDMAKFGMSGVQTVAGIAGAKFPKSVLEARYPKPPGNAGSLGLTFDTPAPSVGKPQGPRQRIEVGKPVVPDASAKSLDPNFNNGVGDPELAGSYVPPKQTPEVDIAASEARLEELTVRIETNQATQAELMEAADLLDQRIDRDAAAKTSPVETAAARGEPEGIPVVDKQYTPADYATDNAHTRARGQEVDPLMEELAAESPTEANFLKGLKFPDEKPIPASKRKGGFNLSTVKNFLGDDKGELNVDAFLGEYEPTVGRDPVDIQTQPDAHEFAQMGDELLTNTSKIPTGSRVDSQIPRPQRSSTPTIDQTARSFKQPTAQFAYENKPGWGDEGAPETPLKIYRVQGGELDGSDVSAQTLREHGIAIPEDAPIPGQRPASVPNEFMPDQRRVDEFMPDFGPDARTSRYEDVPDQPASLAPEVPPTNKPQSMMDKIRNFMGDEDGSFDPDFLSRGKQLRGKQEGPGKVRARLNALYDKEKLTMADIEEGQRLTKHLNDPLAKYNKHEDLFPDEAAAYRKSANDQATQLREEGYNVDMDGNPTKPSQAETQADADLEKMVGGKDKMDQIKLDDIMGFLERFKKTLKNEEGSVPRRQQSKSDEWRNKIAGLESENAPDESYKALFRPDATIKEGDTWKAYAKRAVEHFAKNEPKNPIKPLFKRPAEDAAVEVPVEATPAPAPKAKLIRPGKEPLAAPEKSTEAVPARKLTKGEKPKYRLNPDGSYTLLSAGDVKAPVDLSKLKFGGGERKPKAPAEATSDSTLAYGQPGSGKRSPIPARKPGESPIAAAKRNAQETIPETAKTHPVGSAAESPIADALFGRGDLDSWLKTYLTMARRNAKDSEFQTLIPEALRKSTDADGNASFELAAGETWRGKARNLHRAAQENRSQSKIPMGEGDAVDPKAFNAAREDPEVAESLRTMQDLEKRIPDTKDPDVKTGLRGDIERQHTVINRALNRIKNFMSDEAGEIRFDTGETKPGQKSGPKLSSAEAKVTGKAAGKAAGKVIPDKVKKERYKQGPTKLLDFSELKEGPTITARPEHKVPEQSWLGKAKDLPKGLMSVDLPFITSAAFRQTKPLAWSSEWFKAWGKSAKAYGDEAASKEIFKSIMNSKNFKPQYKPKINSKGEVIGYKEMPSRAETVGVHLSGSKLLPGEEQIRAQWAEKLPWVKASNRAYSTFINHMRQTKLDEMLDLLDAQGNGDNLELGKTIGDFVNTATGRGSLKWEGPGGRKLDLERIAPVLQNTMWAPRLLAANTKFLNPWTYINADPLIRGQYAVGAARMAATWIGFAGLAKAAGADVSLDPTNSDFGKIKIGDTRIDPAGGMQQLLVFLARQAPGSSVGNSKGELLGFPTGSFSSSASGKRKQYGDGAFPIDRASIAEDFAASKLDPVTRLAYELMRSSSKNRPVHLTDKVVQMALPIMAQDIHDAMKKDPNLMRLLGSSGLSSAGMGVNTYGKGERFSDPVFTDSIEDFLGADRRSLSGTIGKW